MKQIFNKIPIIAIAVLLISGLNVSAQTKRFNPFKNPNGGAQPVQAAPSNDRPAAVPRDYSQGFRNNPSTAFQNRRPAASPAPAPSYDYSRGFRGNSSRQNNRYYNPAPSNNYRGNGGNYYNYRNPHYNYYYGGAYHARPSYYRPYSRSTFGIRLGVLPASSYSFNLNRNRYYYHGGSYYRYYNNYYETIAPPYGAVVPLLPGGAIMVPIGGRSYYEYGGTYYEPRMDPYGNRVYAVAGTDGILQSDRQTGNDGNDIISDESIQSNMEKEGMMTELPSTFKTVTLGDKIYYVSPSGDYYVKLVDENGKTSYQLTTKATDQ